MKDILTLSATIILGVLMFGLLFYSFYIVLTSKDEEKSGEISADTTERAQQDAPGKSGNNKVLSGPPDKSPAKGKHKPQRAA